MVVPVTVYVVVVAGLAVTGDPVVAESPPGGVHEYVVAPVASNEAEDPAQIVSEFTATTGFGFTVTVAVAVPEQPPVVPVTVYVVVTAGFAVTEAPVVAESPPGGDHVYVVAPEAVKVAEAPAQIVGELTAMTGFEPTVTVAVAVPVQLPVVPVTVYVVVVGGVAVTVAPVVAERLVAGDHVYDAAPLAFSVAASPGQMVGELTIITGSGLTVTVAVAVEEQPNDVPVTVYVVVVVGVAKTGDPVVEERFVPGDQLYVVPPVAVNVAVSPAQIVAELTAITGIGFTVTVAVAVPVQPAAVPVTVYVIVVGVVDVTVAPVVPERLVAGDHV